MIFGIISWDLSLSKYLSEKMHTYVDKILKPDGILYSKIDEQV
jgi:hypothetical protein